MICVVSEYVGEMGGGAKSPLLLCEMLRSGGHEVVLFVLSRPPDAIANRLAAQRVAVVPSAISRGARFDIPRRMLALQVYLYVLVRAPSAVCIYSLSTLTHRILRYRLSPPVYAWECTEALAGTKFVDTSIAKVLHRLSAVWVPALTIERNVRRTYGYRGDVRLVPFWVQAGRKSTDTSCERTGNFLFIGRYDRDKGLDYLCEAFALVVDRYPRATLTLCGSGDVDWVTGIATHASITVRGEVFGDALEDAIMSCDAVVLPSLHEGYPLCLLEAAARMKPIIATAVGAVPEMFSDNCGALLIPSRNTEAIAEAVCRVLAESHAAYAARCIQSYRLFCRINDPRRIGEQLSEALNVRVPN